MVNEPAAKRRRVAKKKPDQQVLTLAAARRLLSASREVKFIDVQPPNTTQPGTAGSITLLTTITQGVNISERVGDAVRLRSIQFNFVFGINAAITEYDYMSYMFVYDNQTTGSTPAVTDLITNANPLAFKALTTMGRWTVLRKDTICMSINGPQSVHVNGFIPLNNKITRFSSATSTAVSKGAVYLMFLGANNTNKSAINAAVRLAYTDA